jgi:BirA family transcriptional regulator, biotin operon repressor / biotin---[acetyl-CoA-carboxylase] ligase
MNAEFLSSLLTTERFGRELRCFDEVGSTNTIARDLARAGAVEGTVVIADAQTQGRGRLGRSWASPAGRNLYLSIVLRPQLPDARLGQVSLVAGVASCEAVREWCPALLKWPNDVLVDGRKVAGLLIESEGEAHNRFLILGIGVNLNTTLDDFPEELRAKAGSIRIATSTLVDRERFTASLLLRLERRYDELHAQGFAPLRSTWETLSTLMGADICVDEPAGRVEGIALGLDDDGALRVRLASGEVHRVVAGDVTVVAGYRR